MKAKTLYTCEICHTDYADRETAKKCEKSHITEVKESKMFFKPIHMGCGSYPYKIEVEFADGHKLHYRL